MLLALALTVSAATAKAATLPVRLEFQAFAPSTLNALPGDTVTWTNTSGRLHTVTADDGRFDSGELPDGARFAHTFTTAGTYPYHCAIHPRMIGKLDVRRVTLNSLSSGPLPTGSSVTIDGRTADPAAPVHIEQDAGAGFQTVTTASPRPDGTWSARLTVTHSARLRAAVGADLSTTRQIRVIDRTVRIKATRGGVSVIVAPPSPNARVALQILLRERFGWWPVATTRLDYLSRASFRVHGPIRARVALLARDAWTPLALSRVIQLGRR
jgi:plastocyanin